MGDKIDPQSAHIYLRVTAPSLYKAPLYNARTCQRASILPTKLTHRSQLLSLTNLTLAGFESSNGVTPAHAAIYLVVLVSVVALRLRVLGAQFVDRQKQSRKRLTPSSLVCTHPRLVGVCKLRAMDPLPNAHTHISGAL